MRGKLCDFSAFIDKSGITPAHAGKTRADGRQVFSHEDHPRACGENRAYDAAKGEMEGSPPRMRGKHAASVRSIIGKRITPAHAGKTSLTPPTAQGLRDHPRACGENDSCHGSGRSEEGSPPRMRGKHFGNGVFPWLILVLSLDPL